MKQTDFILNHETEVLEFLRSKYPLYHLSNVFFRDVQFGIQTMLYRRGMSVGYSDAERIAKEFVTQLEKKKVLNPIDQQSWVLNYPQYKKPATAPAPSAKPAAKPAGPIAPGSAAPGAKPSLPPLSRPAAPGAPKPGGLPPLSKPAGTATAKPGGLPPLSRPAAGAATAKPGGLPPLKAAPKPAAPAQTQPATAQPEVAKEAPQAAPAEGKKPLPPLGGRTPAGPKK